MPVYTLTSDRTAMAQALITAWGSGVKLKAYDGAMPTDLGTPAGVLLATFTNAGSIGSAASGAITLDVAGFAQTNSSHVSGTPTFIRVTSSDDAARMDIPIGTGADEWEFTGAVVTGNDVALPALSIAMPNASV